MPEDTTKGGGQDSGIAPEVPQTPPSAESVQVPATVAPAAPMPSPVPSPSGKVEMTKEQFDAIMSRVNTLEEEARLRAQADDVHTKGRIEELRRQGKLMLNMKLRSVDGKLVVGWRTLQDDVYFADGKLIEVQKVEIWFQDGEKKELTMRQWATMATYVQCEVLAQSTDADGNKFVKVQTPQGETLDINVNFVN